MAKRNSKISHPTRSRKSSGKNKNNTGLIVGIIVAAIAIGGLIWWLCTPPPYHYDASKIDAFVEAEMPRDMALPEKVDVYVDFSDGLQFAYADNVNKSHLQSIVNKLTKTSEFYALADLKVTPMGKQDSKAIYNQIISPASYNHTAAPLEEALKQIVKNGNPAVLITDFEEYSGSKIQHENWAKQYFIDWMRDGNSVNFFIMDFNEKGKSKKLYFAVFDGRANDLLKQVEKALEGRPVNYQRFQLSNNDFPTGVAYTAKGFVPAVSKGGTYHDVNGNDVVTMVDERGTTESYRHIDGCFADYYPLEADKWSNVVKYFRETKKSQEEMIEAGTFDESKTPLLRNLINDRVVDLSRNSGYVIDEVDIKVTDVSDRFIDFVTTDSYNDKIPETTIANMFVISNSRPNDEMNYEMAIDLDPNFNGFSDEKADKGLYRVDVFVKKATPKYELVDSLFSWDGNSSLATSVRNALQAVSPDDQPTHETWKSPIVLYTYYIKMK